MKLQETDGTIAKLSALTPLIYVTFIGFFFLWVSISEGHFPQYGNPDPKGYPVLSFIEIVLMMLVPISGVLWLIAVIKSALTSNWNLRYYFLAGAVGFLLITIMVLFDPMGIFNWLAD